VEVHTELVADQRQCSATGLPPQGYVYTANFDKKLHIPMLYLEKGSILSFVIRIRNTHRFIIDSFIQHVLRFVFVCLHSYRASIYM
jgi:hypothetical protein